MVTDKIGLFGEVFLGDDVFDSDDFDHAAGFGVRFLY